MTANAKAGPLPFAGEPSPLRFLWSAFLLGTGVQFLLGWCTHSRYPLETWEHLMIYGRSLSTTCALGLGLCWLLNRLISNRGTASAAAYERVALVCGLAGYDLLWRALHYSFVRGPYGC